MDIFALTCLVTVLLVLAFGHGTLYARKAPTAESPEASGDPGGPEDLTSARREGRSSAMKINKIDHLCIAVRDLEAAKKVWAPILGQEPDDEYVHEGEKIRVARYYLGEVGFELMESTSPDGDVARWIDKRGEGLMLVSLNVDNTAESVDELKARDYPFIGGLRDFRDCQFAFMHPKAANGVLLELIDDKWDHPDDDE